MKINFIDLQAQYHRYKKDIDNEIFEVLESGRFIGGEKLALFEHNLSVYTGAKHAIGCASGTDALMLSLMALDIGEGDEVVTSPFSFIAAAEAISLLGAKPVFVDIDESSYNIDASKIESVITDKTKAILPVSLFGQCCDMDTINEIAKKYELSVIEDACQSFGAVYKGKKSCNLSTIACTSFFPSKPLGAYGDGGAVFTNDDEIASKIRMLSNHGQSEKYTHRYIGINSRLDALQATILGVKLRHFDDEVRLREEIGLRYNDLLEDTDIITPKIFENSTSVYAQYSIRVKDREEVIKRLNSRDIPTIIHYPKPIHLQEAFSYLAYSEGDFPISELVSKEILSLPMSAYLSEAEQDFIVEAIKS